MKNTKICPFCGGEVLAVAKKCKHCRELLNKISADNKTEQPNNSIPLTDNSATKKNFSSLIGIIHRKASTKIAHYPGKPWMMFAMMNIAICISVTIVTFGDIKFALLAVVIGAVGPFIMLGLSKFLAKMSFDIKEINPNDFSDDNEKQLYHLVKVLADKAGITTTPEVGIYKSPDMNAFATGRSRNNSLVVFSSALIDEMDEEAIGAVAAHEIAHIANGDMLSMTIMQSVINTIIIVIDIVLFFALDDAGDNFLEVLIKTIARWVIVGFFMFLGNLLMLWFSRHREFQADRLAAELLSPDSMIKALRKLQEDETLEIPKDIVHSQEAYAAFKISSSPASLDLFSTHPAIARRIENLKRYNTQ